MIQKKGRAESGFLFGTMEVQRDQLKRQKVVQNCPYNNKTETEVCLVLKKALILLTIVYEEDVLSTKPGTID